MKWLVSVFYPARFYPKRDERLGIIARQHDPAAINAHSGIGFGERDITFEVKDQQTARAIEAAVVGESLGDVECRESDID